MCKRLLLTSDGTKESLITLREGALIAQTFGAEAHLLIIDPEVATLRIAERYSFARVPICGKDLLDLGLQRLRQLGVEAQGELLHGEPTQLITDRFRRLKIDLVVLGHRQQSFSNRW